MPSLSEQHARAAFTEARVARLATTDEHAQPHVVPVTFAVTGDEYTVVTAVDHKPKRTSRLRRLRNIEVNARVSMLTDHYEDDWDRLWWVRADGTAELAAAHDHPQAIHALAQKYPQYQQRPPSSVVILIRVRKWTGWAANAA